MAKYRDERRRLDALFATVRRKAGPLIRLDDEQSQWLAAWRQDQPPFDYETMINSTDEIGAGLRSDIKRILYGDVPTMPADISNHDAAEIYRRMIER